MNNILLISEKTLKSQSLINDNVGSEFILPSIQTAQDIGLQPLIGTYLYDKLRELVGNGTISNDENASYKTLLDTYITPYLAYKVMSDIQIPLAYKMRNAGIIQTNNEYQTNSIMKDVQQLSTFYDQKATFYANRLSDYLLANSGSYPEYMNWRDYADMPSNKNAYNTGIYLGNIPVSSQTHPDVIIITNNKN